MASSSPHTSTQVADCVALVTGGNRGIGQAFVEELLAGGARKVYCGARNVDEKAIRWLLLFFRCALCGHPRGHC